MRCLSEGGPGDQGGLVRMKTVRTTRSFHIGRWCQYLTEHPFLFFGSFLSYSLSSQDKVCPVGGCALHPHSAAPVKHIRTMPAGGDALPHLKPELAFSVFWSKTALGGRIRSLLGRKPICGALSLKQLVSRSLSSGLRVAPATS